MVPRSVSLPPAAAEALDVAADLTVSRIWPRGPGRLSLELRGGPGQLLAGQMIDDDGDRQRIAAATARRARVGDHVLLAPAVTDRGGVVGVLVQAGGADRRLLALPGLLAEPGAHLLVHRPERRAVVFLPGAPPTPSGIAGAPVAAPGERARPEGVYVRVFRPGRTAPVVHAARLGAGLLADLPGFTAPAVATHRGDDGVVVTSALPGVSLREQPTTTGAAGIGRLLHHLARVTAPPQLPLRDVHAERAWVGVWLERVGRWLPEVHIRLAPVLQDVAEHLRRSTAMAAGIIHGDLHDGQYAFRPAQAHVVPEFADLAAAR